MASAHRTSTQSLEQRAELAADPYRAEFYQAVRLLDALSADMPRLGTSSRASQEPVRLGNEPSLEFPTSMLSGFQMDGPSGKDKLDVRFFGLFGPNGPLPLHLTEYARSRDRHEQDRTMRAFADVFHHRMLSLLYRAWAQARPTTSYDRPDEDRFYEFLAALIGAGMPAAQGFDVLADHSRVYFAGVLGMQHRPSAGLAGLVEDYLQVPARVEEFVGEWLQLPQDAYLRLGLSEETGTLGTNATAGSKAWFMQGKFRICCGPMGKLDFDRLLPNGNSLPGLAALVKQYAGEELAWELGLILKAPDVPSIQLGHTGQLGWSSWLGQRQRSSDSDDVVLRPAAALAVLGDSMS